MEVFEVKSTNLDVNDGIFADRLFSTLEGAIEQLRKIAASSNSTDIIEDIKGELEEFDGKSLKYTVCSNKPAIYYRSTYGNYRMVVFVKTRKVELPSPSPLSREQEAFELNVSAYESSLGAE